MSEEKATGEVAEGGLDSAPDPGADGRPARSHDESGADGESQAGAEPDGQSGSGAGTEPEAPPESELDAALRERAEYLDLAQRTRAELENYKRRVTADAAAAELRGRSAVARDLIPALDNLERALLAAGVAPDGSRPDGEPASQEVSAQTALAEGVALVYREIEAGLRRAGVESFDPAGDRFDPARHEAVSTVASAEVESGHVVETLERGYAIGEQILRPARVIVSD